MGEYIYKPGRADLFYICLFFSSRPCECIWLAILEHKITIVLALKNRYGDQWNKVVIWLLAL